MPDTTAPVPPTNSNRKDHRVPDPQAQTIWEAVSDSPLRSLWDFQGVPVMVVLKRATKSIIEDNLVSRAAELGFYFLFALFPMLVSASAILGLAAKRASLIYIHLLHYLALVIPHSAFTLVIETFNQTTAASTAGKLTFGLVAAIWSASVGFAAIQDGMNAVYRVKETRPYWKARGSAILVTMLLAVIVTIVLAVLLGADFATKRAMTGMHLYWLAVSSAVLLHVVSVVLAGALLMLLFAIIYYYAPDLQSKCWHWLTPGAALGIFGWVAASLGLRAYLHYFNTFTLTYGSLGAVIILLTWFYITGLMLLIGAEINSEIQAAVAEKKLKEEGLLPPQVTTDKKHPLEVQQQPQPTSTSSAALQSH